MGTQRSPKKQADTLSRRERQIMDAIYRLGKGTVSEIRENIPSPPSYSAVRAMIRILVDKEWLSHQQQGASYVYRPTVSRQRARRSALSRVVDTFFAGSAGEAITALIDDRADSLTDEQLDQLERAVAQARAERK